MALCCNIFFLVTAETQTVSHGSLHQLLLEHCNFWNTDISQGSVVTYLRYGGIFKYVFDANLPLSLSVKEF